MARAPALIGGALARALARNRDRLNAQVGSLRRAGKTVDGDALGLHLEQCVGPAIEAVESIDDASSDRVATALFQLSAELVATDLLVRSPLIRDAWRVLLPPYARILRYDARRIAGAVTNAIFSLSSSRGASPERWIAAMGSVAEFVRDSTGFFDAGRVAAWCAGRAHTREAALRTLPLLNAAIVGRLFDLGPQDGLGESPRELADALRKNRWLDPAMRAGATSSWERPVARLGGFRGFGGEFLIPPRVGRIEQRLIATAGDDAWEVHADAFGSSLTPILVSVSPTSEPASRGVRDLPGVEEPNTSVSVDGVTAVTLRYSHSILVFATP